MSQVPVEVLEDHFDGDTPKPGFSGIGVLRGRTEFSDDETVINDHFWTNSNSNVYAATDNMPGEVWAMLMGQYARSNLTARERLLKLFDDMHKKFPDEAPSIPGLADMIRNGSNVQSSLEAHSRRAGDFIKTWGIDYGHASLRDSGTIGMVFEGVSQRATKELEKAREGAYQEQSTRAIPFSSEFLGMPPEVLGTQFETRFRDLGSTLMNLYQSANEKLPGFFSDEYAHLRVEADERIREETGKDLSFPDRAWSSIIGAASFDRSRYAMPQFMTTNLGVTLNTRRFQDMLTDWQSSELWEMQLIGKAAQHEANKLFPSLMPYGNRSEFAAGLPERRRESFNEFMDEEKSISFQHYDVSTKLISATENLEDLVIASIIFNGSNGHWSMDEIADRVSRMSPEEKVRVAERELKGRPTYEVVPKSMEVGSMTFERFYDVGAYRDLQRQRGDRQQRAPYSVVGFNRPDEMEAVGLREQFDDAMFAAKELYDDLIDAGMHGVAEYVLPMAAMVRHVTTKDVAQQVYEAKLRTQPAGIPSYRKIAIDETETMFDIVPSIKGLVPYTPEDYPLGRLPEAVNGFIRDNKD